MNTERMIHLDNVSELICPKIFEHSLVLSMALALALHIIEWVAFVP